MCQEIALGYAIRSRLSRTAHAQKIQARSDLGAVVCGIVRTGHGLDCERWAWAKLACGSRMWGVLSAPAGDKVKLPACLLGPRQLS